MEIITRVAEMQARASAAKKNGQSIALVPTMGFLHQGHLSLMQEGRRRADLLVASVFVNPTQFGPQEDFASYPRDLQRDAELAAGAGVDWLFVPEVDDMYPQGFATAVTVSGLTEVLCGASRPAHFQGVTTVVCKLFGIVQPQVALFGRKDFQQLAVIRRMTLDLNLPVEIIGLPTVREPDGLAMSSRNAYLSAAERRQAPALIDALRLASAAVKTGERNVERVLALVRNRIDREPDAVIDYAAICNGTTLQAVPEVDGDSVLLLAVRIGRTRLIDNHTLFEEVDIP